MTDTIAAEAITKLLGIGASYLGVKDCGTHAEVTAERFRDVNHGQPTDSTTITLDGPQIDEIIAGLTAIRQNLASARPSTGVEHMTGDDIAAWRAETNRAAMGLFPAFRLGARDRVIVPTDKGDRYDTIKSIAITDDHEAIIELETLGTVTIQSETMIPAFKSSH